MALDVTIYDEKGQTVGKFADENDVDYVSYVAPSTYGPPALIAPAKGQDTARAHVEERVLYINTGLVPMWMIERTS